MIHEKEYSRVSKIPKGRAEEFAQLFHDNYPTIATRSRMRLLRAVDICSTVGACRPAPEHNQYCFWVTSQSNPRGAYLVDTRSKTCTCPDHGRIEASQRESGSKQPYICKHRLAIGLHLHGPEWKEAAVRKEVRAKVKKHLAKDPKKIERSFAVKIGEKLIAVNLIDVLTMDHGGKIVTVEALHGNPFSHYTRTSGTWNSIFSPFLQVSADKIVETTT
jgi:hypothetical protein